MYEVQIDMMKIEVGHEAGDIPVHSICSTVYHGILDGTQLPITSENSPTNSSVMS